MARISVSLPADVVLDVMVLADLHNAQDAVEAVLRDYLSRRRRTDAVTGQVSPSRDRLEGRRPSEG
jgi:hypothetical protein